MKISIILLNPLCYSYNSCIFQVFSLYNYIGSAGVMVLVFQIFFVLFLIYFIANEILAIKKQKCEYFKQFWNILEFLVICLSIVAMAMYGMRTVFTNVAIDDVHNTGNNEFVNFNTLAGWCSVYTEIVSFIVFLASLKFLKLLRFDKRIGMLSATLKYAAKDLMSFSFTFNIYFFAFIAFGYVVFGPYMSNYQGMIASIKTTFQFAMGVFDFNGLIGANYILGAVYFFLFIFIVFMGLMNMFIAILMDAFAKVKEELAEKKNDHQIFSYIASTFKKKKINKKSAMVAAADPTKEIIKVAFREIKSKQDSELKISRFDLQKENYQNEQTKIILPRRLAPINQFN